MTINNETIKDIAEMLKLGMRCYLHKKTGKYHIIAGEEQWDYMDEDEQVVQQQELDEINAYLDDYIAFEQMFPRAAFQMMFDFETRAYIEYVEASVGCAPCTAK